MLKGVNRDKSMKCMEGTMAGAKRTGVPSLRDSQVILTKMLPIPGKECRMCPKVNAAANGSALGVPFAVRIAISTVFSAVITVEAPASIVPAHETGQRCVFLAEAH